MRKNLIFTQRKDRFKDSSLPVINLDTLQGLNDCLEEQKRLIEKAYIEWVGSLSENQPFQWWATALSEKNSFTSKCFSRIYRLFVFDKFIHEFEGETVVILSDDWPLILQIFMNYDKICTVRFEEFNIFPFDFFLVKRYLLGHVKQLVYLGQQIFLWWSTQSFLKKKKKVFTESQFDVVLRSWFDHRNYKTGKLKDVFFPGLDKEFTRRGEKVCYFAGIRACYRKTLEQISQDKENVIIPSFLFLKLSDIFKSYFMTLFKRCKVNRRVTFQGLPVFHIAQEELYQDICSLGFFAAMLEYYASLRFFQHVKAKRMIQIFENYGWEKMSLLGARRANKRVKIFGFQHAFIARNTFKYFPSWAERGRIPLPDRIITMGKRTKNIMEEYGNYGSAELQEGVALRQQYLHSVQPLPRNKDGDIFVPLTITVEDTIKVITFLYHAGLQDSRRKVYLRFHPVTPKEKVFAGLSFKMPANFYISDADSIYAELERAAVVLYTFTTVCIEALALARPVIYLDVNYPMDMDPLFECQDLRRSVRKPNELIDSINDLVYLSDTDFSKELQRATEYLDGYFNPMNKQNLESFYY